MSDAEGSRPTDGPTVLLTYHEAAERLRCCVKTVRKYVKAGLLKIVRVGRLVRIPERELEAFIRRLALGGGL